MTIEDYDEMYALWKTDAGIGLSEADDRKSISRYLSHNPRQSFVCRMDGKIIGTILCGNDGRRAYLYHLMVAPEHRRRGIAKELVRLALNAQKELGIERCNLFIITENTLGMEFWRKVGFYERQDITIRSKDL